MLSLVSIFRISAQLPNIHSFDIYWFLQHNSGYQTVQLRSIHFPLKTFIHHPLHVLIIIILMLFCLCNRIFNVKVSQPNVHQF